MSKVSGMCSECAIVVPVVSEVGLALPWIQPPAVPIIWLLMSSWKVRGAVPWRAGGLALRARRKVRFVPPAGILADDVRVDSEGASHCPGPRW